MIKYETVQFETSFGRPDQMKDSDLPEIAFAGKSNVGKSSLLNKVMGRKSLARVSSVPGKTVTINFFKLNACRFVDLPGYGYAKVSDSEKLRWADLMENYFKSGRNIKLVVQLVDMRHDLSPFDIDMLDFLSQTGYKFIVVMTKCDKLNKTERLKQTEKISTALAKYGNISVVAFSALKGEGTNEVRRLIEKSLEEN